MGQSWFGTASRQPIGEAMVPAVSACLLIAMIVVALPGPAESRSATENLKARIGALETEEAETKALSFELLGREITVGGVLELEGYVEQSDVDGDDSDLDYSVDLEIGAELNDYLSGEIVLVHEEGASHAVEVDEAVISLELENVASAYTFSLDLGKLYVPFGRLESALITGSLVEDLAETRAEAIVAGVEREWLGIEVGVFRGDVDERAGDKEVDTFVAAVEVTPIEGLSFGASYLSDLGESDADLVTDTSLYRNSVPGGGLFVVLAVGPLELNWEYVAALEAFGNEVIEEGEDLSGNRPSAWSAEASWLPAEQWLTAVRVEGADDYLNDPLRFGITISLSPLDNMILGVEYMHAKDDEDTRDTLTAQWAFEF